MKALSVIKDRFTPSQPAVKAGMNGVRYHEYTPDTRLTHYIFFLSTALPFAIIDPNGIGIDFVRYQSPE